MSKWFYGLVVAVICFIVSLGTWYYNAIWLPGFTDYPAAYGQMGDFFGGLLNPVLAFASFMALLYTIRIQSEELKRSVDAQRSISTNASVQNNISVLMVLFERVKIQSDNLLRYLDTDFEGVNIRSQFDTLIFTSYIHESMRDHRNGELFDKDNKTLFLSQINHLFSLRVVKKVKGESSSDYSDRYAYFYRRYIRGLADDYLRLVDLISIAKNFSDEDGLLSTIYSHARNDVVSAIKFGVLIGINFFDIPIPEEKRIFILDLINDAVAELSKANNLNIVNDVY